MKDSDAAWRADRYERGFVLPKAAPLFFRLWGIRHIRLAWLCMRVVKFANDFDVGIGVVSQYDRWVFYAIYRGWA